MRVQLHGEMVCFGTGGGDAPAEAPTIAFVHGAGFDHSVWVMPARYFARHGYRVVAPDLPGHGRSTGEPLRSIEAMADWLADLFELLGTRPVTVVGHSMGSLVALACARRHPQQVERIALLGTSAPMPVGPPLLAAAADNDHAAIDMANTWSHSTAGRLGASAVPGMSNMNGAQRWMESMPDGVYHADLAACNAYQPDLGVGDLPVLVIAGSEDRMTPVRAGRAVAEALPGAQTVTLPGCGHAMLSEQPNPVLDALKDFVMGENK